MINNASILSDFYGKWVMKIAFIGVFHLKMESSCFGTHDILWHSCDAWFTLIFQPLCGKVRVFAICAASRGNTCCCCISINLRVLNIAKLKLQIFLNENLFTIKILYGIKKKIFLCYENLEPYGISRDCNKKHCWDKTRTEYMYFNPYFS